MKVDIFFSSDSFDFDSPVEKLFESLAESTALIGRLDSELFIKFSKTSDFYDNTIEKLYGDNAIPESGLLSSLIYDGNMSKAKVRDVTSPDVIDLINGTTPEYDNCWLSLYGELATNININYSVRNVKTESDIMIFAKHTLQSNTYDEKGYADAFEGIYRNLIFHTDYNDIKNITGGCESFLHGILEMFDVMNCFIPSDGDVKGDVSRLNSKIKFTTCEEGGGKKNRKGEDKLDFKFEIDGIEKTYNCEFHCKLEYIDNQYKTGKYHKDNRMYFGFYNEENKINKILIAHLGDHL